MIENDQYLSEAVIDSPSSIMFTGRSKIVKANGAEPDEFEASVAQELFNLEVIKIDR